MRDSHSAGVSTPHAERRATVTHNGTRQVPPVDKGVDDGHVRLTSTVQRDFVHEMHI